jgi:addiction module HigA family antidote
MSNQQMASKRLRPVHPGDILKNDFLEPLEITSYRLSKELGVSRPTITQLVARRRNVTAEMALRLARYFGTSAQVWQNLEAQYDLEVAITKIGKVVKQKIRPRSNSAPTRRSAAASERRSAPK